MIVRPRMPRKLSIGAETLESRKLLNAHFPKPLMAHVQQLHTEAVTQFGGVSHGTSSYTPGTHSVNGLYGTDSYSTTGVSNLGMVTITANDHYLSTPLGSSYYRDHYDQGAMTLTSGSTGSSFSITYVGAGFSPVAPGDYIETMVGKATETTGPDVGATYSFLATVQGSEVSGDTAIEWTMK